VSVLPANIQDRDGARRLLQKARRRFPFIEKIFADAGYQGPKMARTIAATGCWTIEIVKRSDAKGFVVLPKRWIVERTLAWISRNRRLMRDFERYATTVAAFVKLAMIRIMLKRLTRATSCSCIQSFWIGSKKISFAYASMLDAQQRTLAIEL